MKIYDTVVPARFTDEIPIDFCEYVATLHGAYSEDPSDGEGNERAAKRPRLQDAVKGESIVLGRVRLELLFADASGETDQAGRPDFRSGAVHLSRFMPNAPPREDGSRDYLCSLAIRPGRSDVCNFTLRANVPPQAMEILESAVSLRGTRKDSSLEAKCSIQPFRDADGCFILGFDVCVLWTIAPSVLGAIADKKDIDILTLLTPNPASRSSNTWSPQEFYNNVHVPSTDGYEAEEASRIPSMISGLQCKLYPFQMRTVRWMNAREGKFLSDKSRQQYESSLNVLRHGFFPITLLDGREAFISHWLGMVTMDRSIAILAGSDIKGGLLAEEMGLGKTVEVISLILLHKYAAIGQERGIAPDPRSDNDSSPIDHGATLIISPVSIQKQWVSELETHAPNLKTMVYDGVKSMGKKSSEEDMVKEMLKHDVVFVSYNVLSAEIHFAEVAPEKWMRHAKQYKKKKSPLVQIRWWRCVLDECQMIESGVSQAARVANQIPRQNAWAVSGTPLKKDAKDLFGLLVFLGVAPYCYSQVLWQRLIARHNSVFQQLFQTIAIRHSKEFIKTDITLPPQKRVVISMPFTLIEEQYYSNLYQEMCDDLALDSDGAPLSEDYDPNDAKVIEKMRTWLSRLRQTVLHPEVGERNRRALGKRDGPLRTVAEVLNVMIEQKNSSIRNEERSYFISKLSRGQTLENAKRTQEALDLWLQVLDESSKAVDECRQELTPYETGSKKLEASAVTEKEEDKEELEETETSNSSLGALRLRLRSALDVLHMATFFAGNAYYQLKTNDETTESDKFTELEKLETGMYDKAKDIRKEMLAEPLQKANKFMDKVRAAPFVQLPNCKGPNIMGGFESRAVLDRVDAVCEMMDAQAKKIDDWRQIMKKLLLLPLIDQEDDELQGDEYENSTKQQEEAYVYIEALRAVVADRHDAITGQENGLIKRDMEILLRQARKGEGYSPALMISLLEERQALRALPTLGSLRTCLTDTRGLKAEMQHLQAGGSSRAGPELGILTKALANIQEDFIVQAKATTELEREAELLRDATNARIEYYRQLQAISDNVRPFEDELSEDQLKDRLRRLRDDEQKHESLMRLFKSSAVYLKHLCDESSAEEGPRNCIICSDPIEIGVLLNCGHQFCKECLQIWYGTHRTCPICKKALRRSEFHGISYKPLEMSVQEEEAGHGSPEADSPDSGSQTSLYSGINSATFAQIKNIDVHGSFGTKIDTLARHLLWLRANDPGAKSIIFSQFRDFLDILARAFKRFKIGFATIDDKKHGIEQFKSDPLVECFFLHAKAHASGLNLVNATHVFLCEPLINTAIELQAIARVHRIGQHNPTTVYMYLVEDTVERAIYDISVTRRLEHIGRVVKTLPSRQRRRQIQQIQQDEPASSAGAAPVPVSQKVEDDDIEAANSLELQAASLSKLLASGRSSGEVVQKSDLWDCLFGVKSSRAKNGGSEEARRVIAGFLGAEAAEGRAAVEGELADRMADTVGGFVEASEAG